MVIEEKKDNDLNELKNENEENRNYNDVNYWHVELNDDMKDDILKELE